MEKSIKTPVFCPMITQKDIGGGIKSTIALMNGLAHQNHVVSVLVPQNCEYLSKFDPSIQVLYFNEDPHISLTKPLKYLRLCRFTKKTFKTLPYNTLYLCSDRPALMLALFLQNTDYIMYISRGWFYTNWSARFLRFFLFSKVSKFVGISDKQANLMKQYNQQKERVFLIQNGIQIPNHQFNTFDKAEINLTTIGGICNRKNQMQCLELMILLIKAQFKVKLHIFGTTFTPIDEAYLQTLQHFIAQNQLQEYVFFKGHETNFDVIYSNSDIVISAATEEGFGRTIIESMSYGVPVVANALAGGPSTIITHEVNGLLFDSSTSDLFDKVTWLIQKGSLRKTMIQNALTHVQNHYTEDIMAQNYSNLIENGTR